jgi:pimeloyl-ACP methyl ester carboxylesterase
MPKVLLAVLGLACGLQAATDPHSRFTELDGNRVHYLTYGQGKEALVFIHGWTCDLTFWRFQAPVYEKRRSLLIDLPGHGMSDKPEVSYTMEYFARAVDAVMKDAKVEKATLVGHSMGTPVAVQFLRMHPEQVSGLVIVDGFIPEPPKDDAARQKQAEQSAAMTKMYRGPDYKASVAKMLDFMFTKDTPPALREDIQAKMLTAPQYVVASAMEGMMAMAPLTESWPKLPAMAAMLKRGNSEQYRKFLSAHFQLTGYEVFDGAGHFLMMEQPEKFNAMLKAFLQQ